MRKGYRYGPLIFTTVRQGEGAPLIDRCFTSDSDDNHYVGFAILRSRQTMESWVVGLRREWWRRIARIIPRRRSRGTPNRIDGVGDASPPGGSDHG